MKIIYCVSKLNKRRNQNSISTKNKSHRPAKIFENFITGTRLGWYFKKF